VLLISRAVVYWPGKDRQETLSAHP